MVVGIPGIEYQSSNSSPGCPVGTTGQADMGVARFRTIGKVFVKTSPELLQFLLIQSLLYLALPRGALFGDLFT